MDECFPVKISAEYSHLAHNCHADANCSNTKGSFYCTCLNGYSGNGVDCRGTFSDLQYLINMDDLTEAVPLPAFAELGLVFLSAPNLPKLFPDQ